MADRDHVGLLAAFPDAERAIHAARGLIAHGYSELDAFTPRPVAALEQLIAPGRSSLPRNVLAGGVVGGVTGLLVQWFCNAWDYPLNVGGRPPFSLPPFIPITFELSVLFAALTAFFGVLYRTGLPRLAHPLFSAPEFQRASIDGYFLFVAASDRLFDPELTERDLASLGGSSIRRIQPEAEP